MPACDTRFSIPCAISSPWRPLNCASEGATVTQDQFLERIVTNPDIFGGKPIIPGRRLAVEHVLGMLAAGDGIDTILEGYPWLERGDVLACLVYAYRVVSHDRVEPKVTW